MKKVKGRKENNKCGLFMSGICILVVPWDHKVLLRVCSAFEVKIEGKEVEYSRNQYFVRRIRKTTYGTGSVQLICINLIFANLINI